MKDPPRDASDRRRAAPRIDALSIKLASGDRSSAAVILTGAIGTTRPFAAATPREQRSPGELGHAAEAPRPPPRPRPPAPPAEASPESSAGESGGGARRLDPVIALRAAPTVGLAGLPGLGVDLGELGSASRSAGAADSARHGVWLLPRGLRAIPSLADVSVSIGGDVSGRGRMSRLAAPLRALARKRAASGARPAAAPGIATAPSAPASPRSAPAEPPPESPTAEPPPAEASESPGGKLRRASRYLVNGILDIAIRRFRAAARSGTPRRT